MGIHPQLANVDLAVFGDQAVGRVVILNNPPVWYAVPGHIRPEPRDDNDCTDNVCEFLSNAKSQTKKKTFSNSSPHCLCEFCSTRRRAASGRKIPALAA